MILGIGRIGIDLRAANIFKTRLTGHLNHIILAHIAIARQRVLRFVGATTMLLNAENAAGLQHGVEIGRRRFHTSLRHPIMHIAEGQNLVDAVGWGQQSRLRTKGHNGHRAINRRIACKAGPIGLHNLAHES